MPPIDNSAAPAIGILSLAAELILDIADHLPTERDVSRLSRVSSRFHIDLTDYLLQRNIRTGGSSALEWAARNNHLKMARRLVRFGANVNNPAQTRWRTLLGMRYRKLSEISDTPLHNAAYWGNLAMADLFLDAGADPMASVRGRTPLAVAITEKHQHVARRLIDRLDSLNAPITDNGKTALHLACSSKLFSIVQFLLDAGMDVNLTDTAHGHPPLHDLLESDTQCVGEHIQRALDDSAFRTLVILLEHGAEASALIYDRGERHRDPRVRLLFSRRVLSGGHRYPNKVGRTWMASTSQENIGRTVVLGSPLCDLGVFRNRHQEAAKKNIDPVIVDEFPPLRIGSPQQTKPGSSREVWNTDNTGRLIAALATRDADGVGNDRITSGGVVDPDPFPKLDGQHPHLNLRAQQAWSDFQKTEFQKMEQNRRQAYEAQETKKAEMTSAKCPYSAPDRFPRLSSHPLPVKNASSDVWRNFGRHSGPWKPNDMCATVTTPDAVAKPRTRKEGSGKKEKWKRLQL